MPGKNATPTDYASATYGKRANDIARLIDVLQMELAKHDAEAKADPKNWGFAGDLGKVRSDLIDTVAFLSAMERSDVESFLNDAD